MNYSIYPNVCNKHYQHKSTGIASQAYMNTSSGYESASTDTSLVESYFGTSAKIEQLNIVPDHRSQLMSEIRLMDDDEYDHRKKRRILSRTQREDANRRERLRMEIVNQAYEDLRNVLPFKKGRKRQKMSRMDTVDGAIQYIHTLLEILHGLNYNQ